MRSALVLICVICVICGSIACCPFPSVFSVTPWCVIRTNMNVRFDMVACFVVREGPPPGSHELLQLRRSPDDLLGGAWSTVRGKIEQGEKAWQAALRELREEAGISPLEFYQLDTVDIFYLHGD